MRAKTDNVQLSRKGSLHLRWHHAGVPLAILAVCLASSGCAPTTPTPSASTSATASSTLPVLPTNEEALAIVQDVVPKFLAAEAAASGGNGTVDDLSLHTTEEALNELREAIASMHAQGRKTIGQPVIDNLAVQSVRLEPEGTVISAYGCYDFAGFDMVDSSGVSVRGAGVPDRFSVLLRVVEVAGTYKWDGSEPWPVVDDCTSPS